MRFESGDRVRSAITANQKVWVLPPGAGMHGLDKIACVFGYYSEDFAVEYAS